MIVLVVQLHLTELHLTIYLWTALQADQLKVLQTRNHDGIHFSDGTKDARATGVPSDNNNNMWGDSYRYDV